MLRLSIKDSSGERVFETDRAEILVGSREGADLRLHDPFASPNHCILRAEGDRVRILGLSAAGVTVSGGRHAAEAVLEKGSEFAVGTTVVRVLESVGAPPRLVLEEPPAPPPPPAPPKPPLAHAHATGDAEFAREVRRAMAQAPWYMISLVVHLVLLLLMSFVDRAEPPLERTTQMTAIPSKEMPEPEIPPEAPLDYSDLSEDEDPLDMVDFEEPVSEAVRKSTNDGEISEFDDVVSPDHIGPAGGRRPTARLPKPLPYTKLKGGDETLNKSDLEAEQGRATEEVKRGLGDGIEQAKQRLAREHIVVVRGDFDRIEDVLDNYGWPYTLLSREELLQQPIPKAKILFVNCARKPPPGQCPKLAELVKRLVGRGCWIVTSDWSVDPYLSVAFPLHVHVGGKERSQRDTTVAVAPAGDDELLAGVFPRGGESEWWLEDSSTMVAVTEKATTLVASEDMASRYGSRVVAFKFTHGSGTVVHLVGHFYQKDGNRRGLVAMHRLINNLIVARVRADEKR